MATRKEEKERPKAFKKNLERRGRPTDLTEDLIERICNLIMGGNYIETACGAVGLDKVTYYRWLREGARDQKAGVESLQSFFNHAVQTAVARSEARDLQTLDRLAHGRDAVLDKNGKVIKEAEKPSFQAVAWRLERRFPKRWGRHESLDVDNNADNSKREGLEGLSPAQKKARIDELLAKKKKSTD